MEGNKAKVSGSVVTGPVNPGVQKMKAEETEGGGDGKRLAVGTGGQTGKYNLAKEVARLREENGKLKEGQEQQQRLLETMQLQIQELRCQVFGEADEPEVETNDEATTSDAQGNGENVGIEMVTDDDADEGPGTAGQVMRNQAFDEAKAEQVSSPTGQVVRNEVFGEANAPEVESGDEATTSDAPGNGDNAAVEMVTEPVSLKAEQGPAPTGQVVRNQILSEAKEPEVATKNQDASGSQGNRNKIAVEIVVEPVSMKSEVPIPAVMKTVDIVGLCYYVLQKGTDFESILKQIEKIDPPRFSQAGLCPEAVLVKLLELNWGPAKLLANFILPFCRGNPEIHGVFNKLDRRTVWLHGPSGMGKENWVRKEFPPEQGYLYIYSREELQQFQPREHKGIVAVNLKMGLDHWSAGDLGKLVRFNQDRAFDFEEKKIVIPQWTQRIVTSEHPLPKCSTFLQRYTLRS